MSIVHQIQSLWLIANRNALQYRLIQNHERVLSAMRTPISFEAAHELDLQIALDNASIQTQLLMIDAQEKALGKYLNKVA